VGTVRAHSKAHCYWNAVTHLPARTRVAEVVKGQHTVLGTKLHPPPINRVEEWSKRPARAASMFLSSFLQHKVFQKNTPFPHFTTPFLSLPRMAALGMSATVIAANSRKNLKREKSILQSMKEDVQRDVELKSMNDLANEPSFIKKGTLKRRLKSASAVEWKSRHVVLTTENLIQFNENGQLCECLEVLEIGSCRLYDLDDARKVEFGQSFSNLSVEQERSKGAKEARRAAWSLATGKEGRELSCLQSLKQKFSWTSQNSQIESQCSSRDNLKDLTFSQSLPSLVGNDKTPAQDRLDIVSRLDIDEKMWSHVMMIGMKSFGRNYYLRGDSTLEIEGWIVDINRCIQEAEKAEREKLNPTFNTKLRQWLRNAEEGTAWNWTAAAVILANFFVNIVESEQRARGITSQQADVFDGLDLGFSTFYMLELVINLYIHWFWEFWTNPWSIFDFLVVTCSIVELILQSLGSDDYGKLNIFRTMRVFRILRLFNKFKSMQQIMIAVLASLKPVATAVLILVMVISIYAIIGEQIFKEDDPQHFSTFSQAWFTLLGLATGDSWTSVVEVITDHKRDAGNMTTNNSTTAAAALSVRRTFYVEGSHIIGEESHFQDSTDLNIGLKESQEFVGLRRRFAGGEDQSTQVAKGPIYMQDTTATIFFVTFTFVASIISLNIVLFVMLEGFAKAMRSFESADRIEEECKLQSMSSGFLDPILANLTNSSTPSILKEKIESYFDLFGGLEAGTLSFEGMRAGLLHLKIPQPIKMSMDHWKEFTAGCQLDQNGELSPEDFSNAIRFQLIEFSFRLLSQKMTQALWEENTDNSVLYLGLKMAMLGIFRQDWDLSSFHTGIMSPHKSAFRNGRSNPVSPPYFCGDEECEVQRLWEEVDPGHALKGGECEVRLLPTPTSRHTRQDGDTERAAEASTSEAFEQKKRPANRGATAATENCNSCNDEDTQPRRSPLDAQTKKTKSSGGEGEGRKGRVTIREEETEGDAVYIEDEIPLIEHRSLRLKESEERSSDSFMAQKCENLQKDLNYTRAAHNAQMQHDIELQKPFRQVTPGKGEGGEGGHAPAGRAQHSAPPGGECHALGEGGGGSNTRNSKLNVNLESSMMELLVEIQADIKASRRQCTEEMEQVRRQFENIEQVLAMHTRLIGETKAAVHKAEAAIELVRQMQS
jgi:hypothetical protein